MTDKPTDEALENLFVEETGFDTDDFPAAIFGFARAVLEKWGTPQPEPATQQAGATKEHLHLVRVIADKIEDGTLFQSGIYSNKDLARFVRNVADAATPQPTPTAQADSRPTPVEELDDDACHCGPPTSSRMVSSARMTSTSTGKEASMAKFKGRKLKHGGIAQPPIPKPCAACNGSGHYDSAGSPKCSACNGTGKQGGQHVS